MSGWHHFVYKFPACGSIFQVEDKNILVISITEKKKKAQIIGELR